MKLFSVLLMTILTISSITAQQGFGAIIEGPLLIEDSPGHIVMKAADNSYWTLTVDPFGQLNTTAASFTTIDVSMPNTESYTKDVSVGDEEAISVFQQADNYIQSAILFDASTNWQHIYTYVPVSGFTGSDQVTLLLETGSDGASPNTQFEYLTIRFTVTN